MTGTTSSSPTHESPPTIEATVADLIARARMLVEPGRRRLLGITGAPGAGKSTLTSALLAALGQDAVLVPMDGFHYANQELRRLGRQDRKGAPDTFDVNGYVALLTRLHQQTAPIIYAPVFDRNLEESIGSAIPVFEQTPLVITEGNYLLLDTHGWAGVRPLLDEVWFLDLPAAERTARLLRRRIGHGHPPTESAAWIRTVDTPNADLVETTRERADLVIRLLPSEE